MKALSLFSNVGISEIYLKRNKIDVVVANELLFERCKFYSHIFPEVKMIQGDFLEESVFNDIIEISKNNKVDFIIATPPCQGMSNAGTKEKDDPRNLLILPVIEAIKQILPTYILIENVPSILKTKIWFKGKRSHIKDILEEELSPLGYILKISVLDSSNYGTPQTRKRAIFLISKNNWDFPEKQNKITVRESIEFLPTLESGEDSGIPWHYAKKHNEKHIEWMENTKTGDTAFNNKIHFPKKDGRMIKGFKTTYKRIEWDKPSPTITMANGSISSQNNVHPGRKNNNKYSDARVLTILELMILNGMPNDWPIPDWASDNLIRNVIGESFPPLFSEAIVKGIKNEK